MNKEMSYGVAVAVLLLLVSAGFVPTKAEMVDYVHKTVSCAIKEVKSDLIAHMDSRFDQQETLILELKK